MADEELVSSSSSEGEGLQGYQTTTEDTRGVEGTTVSAADVTSAAPAGTGAGEEVWQSLREAAQQRGYSFDPTVTDDWAALEHLIKQAALAKRQAEEARQSDIYAQLGRQLAPQAEQIQQYLRQRQQTPSRPAWQAPEWDQRWAPLLERDPNTGLLIGKDPRVPQEIVAKANEYFQWREGFDRDPAAVINGMVEERAKEIAEKTFQSQFQSYQNESAIQKILSDNASWMYQRGPDGQALKDYAGNYMPTPVGTAYIENLRMISQAGVTDPVKQDALAQQLTRGALAQAQVQQTQARTAQAASPQTRQAVGRAPRNPLQALPYAERQATPGAAESDYATGSSLRDLLLRAFKENGITDADIAASATSA